MKTKGVLDRIVDRKFGVILVEEIGKEFTLDVSELPVGYKEGQWFDVEIDNDEIKVLAIDHELTTQREALIKEKMGKLKKKSGSRFKRS